MTGSRSAAADGDAVAIKVAARSAASEDLFDLFMRKRNRYYPVHCRGAIAVANLPQRFLVDRHAAPHCGILAGIRECEVTATQTALPTHGQNVLDLVKSLR